MLTESVRIGREGDIHSLSCVVQIEMDGFAQSGRAQAAKFALVAAAAGHVKFVNDLAAAADIDDADVKGEEGAAVAKGSEEESSERTAAVDAFKMAFYQPTNA